MVVDHLLIVLFVLTGVAQIQWASRSATTLSARKCVPKN
jgi:hypothetical protein